MKFSNWILGQWWINQLKRVQSLPYKKKLEGDGLLSNCKLDILNKTEKYWLSIKQLPYRLDIKAIQNWSVRIKNSDGRRTLLDDPAFTENQIAEAEKRKWPYVLVMIFFPVAESFLYYLTASLYVPGGHVAMKIAVSIFLAVIILLGLDFGFSKHFQYRKAVERYRKGEITKAVLQEFKDWLIAGYIIITLSILTILFAGISRIYFLEYIPIEDLPKDRASSVQMASQMASYVTFFVTLMSALLLGAIKREHEKYSLMLRVIRFWKKANQRRNSYALELIENANRLILTSEQITEMYWQLTIDMKRIFKSEHEQDEMYTNLRDEYTELNATKGFSIDDDVYRKFNEIKYMYAELFKYGVYCDPVIREKIEYARAIQRLPKENIEAYIRSIASKQTKQKELFDYHLNGNGKTIHS